LSLLTTDWLVSLLTEYVKSTGASVDLILVGGLALQAYGLPDRATQDIDGEFNGDLTGLVQFLTDRHIPADLGANISGWSVVAMPPGYRERTSLLVERPKLLVRLLAPTDFIIAKLRRGTELDLDDATWVAAQFKIASETIKAAAENAVSVSPPDTMIFVFRKTVDLFCHRIAGLEFTLGSDPTAEK